MGMESRHAALIYNPVKVDGPSLRRLVKAASAAHAWAAPLFFETTIEDGGQGVTRRALEAGAQVVLVAGGDGTVRAVSEAIAGSGVPLAILPSGTGNLLARNLALPLDKPEPMIDAAFGQATLDIDICDAEMTRADGTVERAAFVVMAGIGLDAEMIARTNPQLKKSVGWVAYVDGAARSLIGAKPFRVLFQIDMKRLHSAKIYSILFANCGGLPAGISLIPQASIRDGIMDVAVIQPTGPLGWIGVWRKVWWDNSVLLRSRAGRRVVARRRDSSIRYLRSEKASVAATAPRAIELDGDEFGEVVRMSCSVRPAELLVIVPEGHDGLV